MSVTVQNTTVKHGISAPILLLAFWFLLFHVLLVILSGEYTLRILLHIVYCLALFTSIRVLHTEHKYFTISTFLRFSSSIALGLVSVIAVYCLKSGTSLSNAAIGAVLQTDFTEAIDYIKDYFLFWQYVVAFFGVSLLSWFTLQGCLSSCLPQLPKKWKLPVILICMFCLLLLPIAMQPVKRAITAMKLYRAQLVVLEKSRAQLSASLNIPAEKKQKGELYVIVLGESASRDYMQAWGGFVPNTPWMVEMEKDAGFVRFQNAYSNNVTTVTSLCAAFEKGNWYTGLTFPNSPTFLTLSNSAGIKTFWLSNQTRYATLGTPISGIASFADNQVFTDTAVGGLVNVISGDMRLLPHLDEALTHYDLSENMLIILHIVGSHSPYKNRYSEQSAKMLTFDEKQLNMMTQNGEVNRFRAYYTSILETDRFLQQVFERLKKLQNIPTVLIYTSDHGENPSTEGGHNEDRFIWSMVRIPVIVWCSQNWRMRYQKRFDALKNNQDKIFTNDLLFDLYMGLADIHFEGKSEQFDISSQNYSLTVDKAATVHGKFLIKNDPDLNIQ